MYDQPTAPSRDSKEQILRRLEAWPAEDLARLASPWLERPRIVALLERAAKQQAEIGATQAMC